MLAHQIGYRSPVSIERPQGSFLILSHEAAVPDDIGRQNRSQTPIVESFHGCSSSNVDRNITLKGTPPNGIFGRHCLSFRHCRTRTLTTDKCKLCQCQPDFCNQGSEFKPWATEPIKMEGFHEFA